jgi:hypothetical protein
MNGENGQDCYDRAAAALGEPTYLACFSPTRMRDGGGVKKNIDSTGEEAVWLGSDPKMAPFLLHSELLWLVSVRVFMKSLFGMAPTTRGTAMLTAD